MRFIGISLLFKNFDRSVFGSKVIGVCASELSLL